MSDLPHWPATRDRADGSAMKMFLDFEASSLSDRSHLIEVAWLFQDGRSESHRIAPAPFWDGKRLSVLLRAAGLARHALRLRDTDEALRETATEILRPVLSAAQFEREVHNLVPRASISGPGRPAHRARGRD